MRGSPSPPFPSASLRAGWLITTAVTAGPALKKEKSFFEETNLIFVTDVWEDPALSTVQGAPCTHVTWRFSMG